MALFHPFRALGCITEAVPFAVQRRGRATFVTVSVGDAWQLYNCAKLTLVLVCQPVRRPGLAALRCGGCSPKPPSSLSLSGGPHHPSARRS